MVKKARFLSIVICGRTKNIKDCFNLNIKETVGIDHEIIFIDNSKNAYTIFEAYNLGIKRSGGDYIVFIHDDVYIHSQGWGFKIINLFESQTDLGLIGVAGAKSKTRMPSVWWNCPEEDKVFNLIQNFPHKKKEKWFHGFNGRHFEEVLVIDGVFIGMRKDPRFRFDEKMNGFHNYDLNISFEYNKLGYRTIISSDIVIEHFSIGTINSDWVVSSFHLYRIYKKFLPVNVENREFNRKQEIVNGIWYIKECLKIKEYHIAYKVWIKLFLINPFLKYHLIFWKNNFKNNWHLIKKSIQLN